jgi:cell wall-associated NlpC family hydrolase
MHIESMKLTAALITLSLLAACAHQAPRESPAETPYDAAGIIERDAGPRSELLLRALGLVGVRYRYGGHSPETGFDCSGLVQYLFNEVLGVALPRRAQDMRRVGDSIGRDELYPGDLVFFDTLREPYSHVGIYLGDQRFIHAPSSGGHVEVVTMTDRYWRRRYNGARRVGF